MKHRLFNTFPAHKELQPNLLPVKSLVLVWWKFPFSPEEAIIIPAMYRQLMVVTFSCHRRWNLSAASIYRILYWKYINTDAAEERPWSTNICQRPLTTTDIRLARLLSRYQCVDDHDGCLDYVFCAYMFVPLWCQTEELRGGILNISFSLMSVFCSSLNPSAYLPK